MILDILCVYCVRGPIQRQIPCMCMDFWFWCGWSTSESYISCSGLLDMQYNYFSVSAGRIFTLFQSKACRQPPALWPRKDGIGRRGRHILESGQLQEPKQITCPQIEQLFVVLLLMFLTAEKTALVLNVIALRFYKCYCFHFLLFKQVVLLCFWF